MTALLKVRDLSVCFDTATGPLQAVEAVSLDIATGESLGLVGESGCGKSMTALSLLDLVPPPGRIVQGELLFEGQDLRRLNSKAMRAIRGRRIGMVFQDPMTSLNPVLTIGRQLGEALQWHESPGDAEVRRRVVDTLERVGIPDAVDRIHDFPHQFSGGQRQRIMIAMAIICRPALLLADEPTTALDVTIQAQIVDLIASLRQELGMAVLWITHDLALLAQLADRVAVMYAGSVVEEGPVASIFDRPRHPYTQGLLESMPDFDAPLTSRLPSIDGAPPDRRPGMPGCPFAPRCRQAVPRCRDVRPVLEGGGTGSRVACWEAGPA